MAYTLKESYGPTTDDSNQYGILDGTKKYIAHSFIPGSSYTITQLGLWLSKIGTPTGTSTVYIYDNGATVPGSSLGQASATLDESTLTTSAAEYKFQFTGVAVTSGTRYWVVIMTTTTGAVNNCPRFHSDSSGQTGYLMFSTAGVTWADLNSYGNTIQGTFNTYEETVPYVIAYVTRTDLFAGTAR